MSGSNLNVGVTADVTDLRAKLALAQQDLRQTTAELRAAAAQARASGQGFDDAATQISAFAAKAEASRTQVRTLESELMAARDAETQLGTGVTAAGAQVEAAHSRMAHSGGVAREVLVMMHETLMGNYTRLGGSTMVLAERTNLLHKAMSALGDVPPILLGIGAAALGAAAIFADWAIQAGKVETAIRGAAQAAALRGGSGPGAIQNIQQGAPQTAQQSFLSVTQAVQLRATIAELDNLTDAQREKLNSLIPAFTALNNNNVSATDKFIQTLAKDTASLEEFVVTKNHMIGAQITPQGEAAGFKQSDIPTQQQYAAAPDDLAKKDLLIQALVVRLGTLKAGWDAVHASEMSAEIGGQLGGPTPDLTQSLMPQPPQRGNIPAQSSTLIDSTAATMGLSTQIADFATRIAEVESGGQQLGGAGSVRGPNEITTSSAGALGIMQVEPDSAFGDHTGSATQRTVNGQTYDLTERVQNVKAGLAILADLFQQFRGDQYKVAVGYNAGPNVATGQVTQSPQARAETAGYTQRLGLAPEGATSSFSAYAGGQGLHGIGDQASGSTADLRQQTAVAEAVQGSYATAIGRINGQIAEQQAALVKAQTAASAALQAADGDTKNAAVVDANATVEAIREKIAALNEEKATARSPMDTGTARQAEVQVSAAKLGNAQKDSDPKQRAIDDAQAEMAIWQQAAQAYGISDAAKEQFDQKYQAAEKASIEAVRAMHGDLAAQWQSDILQIEAKESAGAGTRQEIELRTTAAVKEYWQSVVQSTALTVDQRRDAENKLAEVTKQYNLETATAAKEAQDKSLRATESRLNAETAASRGNVAQIIAIEQQKVDAVRAVHGSESAEYFTALEQQTNAVRTAVEEQVRTEEQAGKQAIAEKTQQLKAEVDAHQITKMQEAEQLAAFVTTQRDLELGSLTSLMGTLGEGTAAYKAAFDARAKLAQQFKIEIDALHAQEVQAAQQAADQATRAYEQAFASIGSAGNRAIEGLIMGHMSWLKAAQTVTQGVVSSMLSLTETLLARWTAYWAAEISGNATATATMTTIQSNSANSGWPQLLTQFGQYLGQKLGLTTAAQATENSINAAGQTTQSAAVAAGTATRAGAPAVVTTANAAAQVAQTAAVTTGQTAQTAAVTTGTASRDAIQQEGIIGRIFAWLAQQLGMVTVSQTQQTAAVAAGQLAQTGAVAAGQAAKTAAVVAGTTASKAATAAINAPTITADAAKAAAGAYAALAGIPLVGPVLAPIAAGVAFAAVMAYESMASLAVGTDNVPRDMIAQIHQGEIVVPAAAAAKLRATNVEGGSAASSVMRGELPSAPASASGMRSAVAAIGAMNDNTRISFSQRLVAGMGGDTGGFGLPPAMAGSFAQGSGAGGAGGAGGDGGDALAAAVRSAGAGAGGGASYTQNNHNTFNHSPSVAAGAGDVGAQLKASNDFMKSFIGNALRNGNLTPPRWHG